LFFIIYYGIAVKVADMLKHKSQKHLRENTGALCSRRSKRYRLINIKLDYNTDSHCWQCFIIFQRIGAGLFRFS